MDPAAAGRLRDSTLPARFGLPPLEDFDAERDPLREANFSVFVFSLMDLRVGAGLFAAFLAGRDFTFAFVAMRRPEL